MSDLISIREESADQDRGVYVDFQHESMLADHYSSFCESIHHFIEVIDSALREDDLVLRLAELDRLLVVAEDDAAVLDAAMERRSILKNRCLFLSDHTARALRAFNP